MCSMQYLVQYLLHVLVWTKFPSVSYYARVIEQCSGCYSDNTWTFSNIMDGLHCPAAASDHPTLIRRKLFGQNCFLSEPIIPLQSYFCIMYFSSIITRPKTVLVTTNLKISQKNSNYEIAKNKQIQIILISLIRQFVYLKCQEIIKHFHFLF